MSFSRPQMTLVWIALCALFATQLLGCGGESTSPVAAITEDTVEDTQPDVVDVTQDIDALSDLKLDSSPPSQAPCPQAVSYTHLTLPTTPYV